MGILNAITTHPLEKIEVQGGSVMHGLKKSDDSFFGFGEAYFSCIEYGKIKGWKIHNKMHMNLIVPLGEVKFVFYSSNENIFREIYIGLNSYSRISVPPKVCFAFQGLSKGKNLILNISDITHDEHEIQRIGIDEIKYDWGHL